MEFGRTTDIGVWLDRLIGGDPSARDELVQRSCGRLRRLARKMLSQYPALHRWEQTDDVLQNSLLRLHRSLADVRPESVDHFFSLAATQIRRELVDLGRHHLSEARKAVRGAEDAIDQAPASEGEPTSLHDWTEFHEAAERLPDSERRAFDLIWYEGLTQEEAADVLKVDVRTVKRHWRSAKLLLHSALDGRSPE